MHMFSCGQHSRERENGVCVIGKVSHDVEKTRRDRPCRVVRQFGSEDPPPGHAWLGAASSGSIIIQVISEPVGLDGPNSCQFACGRVIRLQSDPRVPMEESYRYLVACSDFSPPSHHTRFWTERRPTPQHDNRRGDDQEAQFLLTAHVEGCRLYRQDGYGRARACQ